MKRLYSSFKKTLPIIMILLTFGGVSLAQEENTDAEKKEKIEPKKKKDRPVRAPFESSILIDNQTTVVPTKKTLQMEINHRFGSLENGANDSYGMWANTNIRLGMTYSILKDVSIGIGATKFNEMIDFNAKYNFMKQTRSWSKPVSLAVFFNAGYDSRREEEGGYFEKEAHRLSYYTSLIASVRINKKLSLQLSPSMSHYNAVDSLYSNDIFAIAFDGRYKVSPQTSILFQYFQPLNKHDIADSEGVSLNNPKPNIGLGVEIATSSHAFQIFFSNYQSIQYQNNVSNNTKDFTDGWEGWLIGFNMTRLWNL
ncbi:MAG: hypothetical protein JXR07_08125 [Reichenbachiella sp.]